MHPRRFPSLIVARISGIDEWSGMIPFMDFDLRAVCDDDLVPGSRASSLLRAAAGDLLTQAKDIAEARLGFDGAILSGPYLAALPKLPGAEYELVIAWRASGGISYVASTLPQAHLHQDDNEYAGYDARGRIVHLGSSLAQTSTD